MAANWGRRVRGIASRMGVSVSPSPKHRAGSSRYYARGDSIEVPRRLPQGGVVTLLHEMAHATGHSKRLNRLVPTMPGQRPYAREEVVAQLTADRVARRLGMPARLRHRIRLDGKSYSRKYVRTWARRYGRNPHDPRTPSWGESGKRTRAEATSIMKDVRAAENYIMSFAGGGRHKRARAARGGGA